MRCARCETEFADSATICPNCGTPTHQGIATTFSYLPPGTPPWPTSVPQRMPQQPPQPVQAVRPARSATRGVRNLLIALAIIILTPVIGAGITLASLYSQGQFSSAAHASHAHVTPPQVQSQSTPASTPTVQSNTQPTQLPTPPSFKKTASADLNISFQYPSNWQLGTPQKDSVGNHSITIQSAQGLQMGFQIIRFSATAASQLQFSSAGDVNQYLLADLQQSSQGTNTLQITPSSSSQPTIGGATWAQQDVIVADASRGIKDHFIFSSVQHNKLYYAIIATTPDTYYNDALKKYIQPVFDSFQFLS
jgi:hypothetical protein